MQLAATPYDLSPAFWRIIELRLAGGEASVAAANAAMLHFGARGYVAAHRAQRRLREAWFIAIVTPATKQLGKCSPIRRTESGGIRMPDRPPAT